MSVALIIITHDAVGEALLDTAMRTVGESPVRCRCISITYDCDPRQVEPEARALVDELNSGDGVLVLTDMYGSTPGNVACSLLELDGVSVVSGLNMPMMLRVLNYPGLSLQELVEKAVSGGREGIMDCHSHKFD